MKIKREVKLAITAICAVVILIWGINFLKGTSLFESRTIFYGLYDRVEGLKISSGVMYRGYQVGQVLDISFTGERFDKVLVKFSVKNGLTLPENSLAFIQSADLMGSKVINLIPGDSPKIAQHGDTLRTQIEQGLMEQVSSQMLPLKQKAEHLFSALDSVLSIVQALFNDETKQNLANSFRSIDRTLHHLEGASGDLDTLMTKETNRISAILSHINGITANLEQHNAQVGQVLTNFAAISDSIKQANLKQILTSLEDALAKVDQLLIDVQDGKGTVGALMHDNDLYYNLNQTSENLNRLLVEFRNNPKKFIRLSLIDFSSGKGNEKEYGIVVAESVEALNLNDTLYKEFPDMRAIKYKGKYLYVIRSYKKLKQAQSALDGIMKRYKDAYIVKIDFV